MQPSCEHTRTEIIARRDGVDYVECLDCRQIFEAEDLEPVTVEGLRGPRYLARGARHCDFSTLADSGDLAPLNYDNGIGYFFERGKGAVGVDDDRQHLCGTILLETRENWGQV